MALDFPNAPTNGLVYTAPTGEQWVYEAATNSWTSKGLVNNSGGLKYVGTIDITAAPPTGATGGAMYTVQADGTANAGFGPGITGALTKGDSILNTGAGWIKLSHPSAAWIRTGTSLAPTNTGDVVNVSAGTAALPGLAVVGDTNTGLYSPGADQLAISTGGVQRVFVGSNGNFGVGTPSPFNYAAGVKNVQVEGTEYGVFTLSTSSATNNGKHWRLINRAAQRVLQIQSIDDAGTGEQSAITIERGAADASIKAVSFGTGGVNRLRIEGQQPSGGSATPSHVSLESSWNSGTPAWDKLRFYLSKSTTESYGFGLGASSDLQYFAGTATGTGAGKHEFYANNAKKLSIDSTYLRLAAGTGGIQFGGDTAAANALNDYEEGTWTPTLVGGTTAGSGTYVEQYGRYIKVGKMVSVWLVIQWTAHTGAGNMDIDGLPFAPRTVAGGRHPYAATIGLTSDITTAANTVLAASVRPNETKIAVIQNGVGTQKSLGGTPVVAAGAVGISATYEVA